MSDQKAILTARECFEAFLRSRRMRVTAERIAILEAVARSHGHFTAEAFGADLERGGFHVSVATLYATFALLCEAGLLRSYRFDNRTTVYELVSASATGHMHLVCSVCGKVTDAAEGPELYDALSARRFKGFKAAWHTITVYGLCSQCRRRSRKTK